MRSSLRSRPTTDWCGPRRRVDARSCFTTRNASWEPRFALMVSALMVSVHFNLTAFVRRKLCSSSVMASRCHHGFAVSRLVFGFRSTSSEAPHFIGCRKVRLWDIDCPAENTKPSQTPRSDLTPRSNLAVRLQVDPGDPGGLDFWRPGFFRAGSVDPCRERPSFFYFWGALGRNDSRH
jgi:hypothetical protein